MNSNKPTPKPAVGSWQSIGELAARLIGGAK